MPKRTDIKRILVIGSGPIVIGQACEFDYSGAQACKVLKEDGFEVILVNSNPATIMTDPGLADRTYVEPITAEFIERVIKKERPDALLPTLGGQTGLNAAVELAKDGTLDKYGVEMIGCDLAAIERGEDRKLFNECMDQTLIDYRNRTTETGQSIAATHTLDRSLLDTFYVNLHSVSEALRTALRKQVCEVLFIPDLLQYRVYLDPGIPPESIAVEVKDALKYGMLCWWYGGRDIPLFQLYRSLYETTVERLRDQIRSTHTERPYRIL